MDNKAVLQILNKHEWKHPIKFIDEVPKNYSVEDWIAIGRPHVLQKMVETENYVGYADSAYGFLFLINQKKKALIGNQSYQGVFSNEAIFIADYHGYSNGAIFIRDTAIID